MNKNKGKRAIKNKSGKSRQYHIEQEIQALREKYAALATVETLKRFNDLPLSNKTLKGLSGSKFIQPTDIQLKSIVPALQGKDVLGAAQTGSGKTLAFLVPVLERLFVEKWTRMDGVGAIVISPTRELAYQIFETLKSVGQYHDFSAGLIIGGKNLKFERKRMDQCNILICTPGRLLQHMDENPLFNASTVQVLVLDEADRCLDMGFEQTLNAIIENLPTERQTLLFSATQTNSINDLARLNLSDPIYIGQPEQPGALVIPELLQQSYVVVDLEDKITMLWSFIRNHQKHKIIVFLASCKQVKFVYEMFCKLRPGVSLLGLYGTLHQDRRIAIYNDFVQKSHVVLFATDIASRGLDFPSVNWVVQLDCPEDVTQYVHRAGRSARNKTRGESLLVLMPSEEEIFIEELSKKCIEVRKITIDPKKLFSPRIKMEAYLAQLPELKETAQRAFSSYIKSIFLMRNKRLFDVFKLDFDAYAKSLGLVVTPRLRFVESFMHKQQAKLIAQDQSQNDEHTKTTPKPKKISTKGTNNFHMGVSDSESETEDLFTIKRANHQLKEALSSSDEDVVDTEINEPDIDVKSKKDKFITKAALAKKALKKKLNVNNRRTFDEEGNEMADTRKQFQSKLAKQYAEEVDLANGGIDIAKAKKMLSEEDKYDKQRFRELVKQRHKQIKEKLKRNATEDGNDELEQTEDENEKEAYSDSSDDDNPVDLSWLPDPAKLYKKKSNFTEDEIDEDKHTLLSEVIETDSSTYDSDEGKPLHKKPKVTSKLTLNDAEIIARQLLANS